MQIVEFLAPHFDWLNDPTAWVALLTLVVMEVVLGIDNLIFISILTNKLPAEQQKSARRLGIGAALIMRLVLLATISFIVQLTAPVFTAVGHGFSWRDLILIAGGLFLVWKATQKSTTPSTVTRTRTTRSARWSRCRSARAIFQILLLDLVFSINSIITAVGMTDEIAIMYIAVIAAVSLMLVAAEPLSRFIARNPTIVMLALGLPADDRHDADRRRHGLPRAQGLHLCGDGLLGAGRGPQHAGAARQEEAQAGCTRRALSCWYALWMAVADQVERQPLLQPRLGAGKHQGEALGRSDRLLDPLIGLTQKAEIADADEGSVAPSA